MASYNTGTDLGFTNGTPSSTAFTGTIPAGVATGDVMIAAVNCFTYSGGSPAFSTPTSGSGGANTWAQIGTIGTDSQGTLVNYTTVWYRVATASDPGSTFSISFTGTNGSTDAYYWSGTLDSWTGFYTVSPIGNVAQANAINSATVTTPTTTTTAASSWQVQIALAAVSSSGTITGSPATNRRTYNPFTGIDVSVSDSNGSVGGAGTSIGGGSFTCSASTSGGASAFTIELRTQAVAAAVIGVTPPQIPTPLWWDLLEVAEYRSTVAPAAASPVPQTWRLMDGVNGRPGTGSTGTQPPATATSNASGQVNGLSFYVTEGGTWFEGFWYYCCASGQSTAPAKFALWSYQLSSTSGKLVPGTTVTSGTLTAGAWNWVPLAKPVQLAIWGVYVAQVGVPANAGYPDTAAQFGSGEPYSGGIQNGPLTAFSSIGGSNAPAGGSLGQCPWTDTGTDPAAVLAGSSIGTNDSIWLDVQISNTPPAGYSGSYRLWPNNYDADIDTKADSAVNYVIGTDLVISEPCVLNAIWYYVPGGMGTSGNQWATSADVWRVSDQVRVATQPSPTWINPWTGGVDGQSNTGRWVYTQMPGTVYLQPGEYRVSVYNGNASPNAWGSKRSGYWESTNPGYGPGTSNYQNSPPGQNGITAGPLYAPPPPLSSPTTDYITGQPEPGQSVFAVGPPNQYPDQYVGPTQPGVAWFQNYWVDAEVTPAATYQPDAPDLPPRIPHPLWPELLEIAESRLLNGTQPAAPVTGKSTIPGTGTLAAAGSRTATGSSSITGAGLSAAAASKAATGTSTATGDGRLSAAGIKKATGTSRAAGTGDLSAAGVKAAEATSALHGTGVADAAGSKKATGSGDLTGTGTLAATAAPGGRTSAIHGGGTLTPSGSKAVTGTSSISTATAGTLMLNLDKQIAAAGPSAWWKLTDLPGSTSAIDSSGNGHTGTPHSVTFGNTSAPARPDTSASFTQATPSYVTTAYNPALSQVSLEAWVNQDGKSPGTANPRLIANNHADATGATTGLELYFDHDGTPHCAFGNGTGNVTLNGTAGQVPATGWTQLAATWDGATVILYVNGQQAATGSLSGSLAAAPYDCGLGYNPAYNGDYLNGLLAEAVIYPSALSPATVLSHWNAGSGYKSTTGTGTQAGTGTLVPSTQQTVSGSSTIPAGATLAAAGSKAVTGHSSIAGTAVSTPAGVKASSGYASVPGTATMAPAGTRHATGTSTTAGTGTLTAAASKTADGTSALDSTGVLRAVAVKDGTGQSAVQGTGLVGGTPAPAVTGSSSISGGGVITAGQPPRVVLFATGRATQTWATGRAVQTWATGRATNG